MQLVQGARRMSQRKAAAEPQGLAGWVLEMLRGWRGLHVVQAKQRQLQLVETLPLGGKRQLMLVSCGGERFLVGGGMESVETIVRVAVESSPRAVATDLDESCE
jgi:flagellar biogenesis protein FliO